MTRDRRDIDWLTTLHVNVFIIYRLLLFLRFSFLFFFFFFFASWTLQSWNDESMITAKLNYSDWYFKTRHDDCFGPNWPRYPFYSCQCLVSYLMSVLIQPSDEMNVGVSCLWLSLSVCLSQECGGPAGTGQGVGAVRWTLPGCGVLPEGEGRLQHRPDGEVLDEGEGPNFMCIYIQSAQIQLQL